MKETIDSLARKNLAGELKVERFADLGPHLDSLSEEGREKSP